jgi:small subunit ribosomal protein S9
MTEEPNETNNQQPDAERGRDTERGEDVESQQPAAASEGTEPEGPQDQASEPAESESGPPEESAPPEESSPPEESAPPESESGESEPAESGPETPEGTGEAQPGEPEAPVSGPPADRGEEISGEPRPRAADQPPGAELEPIALEPERELTAEERARLEAEEEERVRLEAERASGDEPVARSGPQVEIPADARIQATGKRKSSIARVVLRPGSGGFEVNSQPLDEYFPRQFLRSLARQPLLTAGYEGTVDVQVRVHGGGVSGQAGAVRHGLARALCEIDPDLRPELKRRGLLTRDARKKERRKAGLKKARKRPQFSKR